MSNTSYTEKQQDKQDAGEVKNFTRVPNMLIFGYQDTLSPQEKWLYVCLKHLCGKSGTRHLSIRYISEQTGISIGALSGSKDPAKNNPGMLRNLHTQGLIHAEIKKKKQNGKEKEQAQYHITITDVWILNQSFFIERSEYEQSDNEAVQNMNKSVQNMNTNTAERSEYEQERSDFDTILRLDNKTTVESKITEQEGDVPVGVATGNDAPVAHATLAPSSSRLPQADVFGEEEIETSPRGKILHIANGTRTTPSEKKREDYPPPPRLSTVPLIPSDEAKKIIGAWSSLFPRSLPVNDALVKAAEALVPCHPSVEDLQKVRDFCVDSNPEWYGTNGRTKGRVTLQDVVKNWEGWLSSEQGKQQAREKQAAKSAPKRSPRMQELREKQRHFSVPPSSSHELHEPQERYEQVGG